jgi:enoyl-CoA hydratase/carnithine racemase
MIGSNCSAGFSNQWEVTMADGYETVEVEREGEIAWVTFNRPDKRNAFSPQLNADMVEVLWDLHGDDSVRVLVLTGAGEAFSAGMDLKAFLRGERPWGPRRGRWAAWKGGDARASCR